ncbi:hypothetical protein [Aquabacterium sp. OR-4]|nr:hypothetical protein [Aquabacterium sp. OR-4]MDT7836423.1 hypothetical protein [Aquabacterium sp. OR-4]
MQPSPVATPAHPLRLQVLAVRALVLLGAVAVPLIISPTTPRC